MHRHNSVDYAQMKACDSLWHTHAHGYTLALFRRQLPALFHILLTVVKGKCFDGTQHAETPLMQGLHLGALPKALKLAGMLFFDCQAICVSLINITASGG
jgi:hypothetical protein